MNPVIDGIKERVNNSASGPYSLFFIVYNWKVFVYLFSDDSTDTRITHIENYFNGNYKSAFLYPLLFLVIYLIVMPMITSLGLE